VQFCKEILRAVETPIAPPSAVTVEAALLVSKRHALHENTDAVPDTCTAPPREVAPDAL
jgi:hypothetical protein